MSESEPGFDRVATPIPQRFDPLRALRTDIDPPLDVLTTGQVFFDLVFTGLDRMPEPGEELWTSGMGSCPGGIANLSTALARLGLRTGLVAGFGDDAYADWMWQQLAVNEGIDLSHSPRFSQFHSSVTVAITVNDDRAMVTHGHDLPEGLGDHIRATPSARAAVVDLASETDWWGELAARGTLLFADIGFDDTGRWDRATLRPLEHCHAFTPNVVEATKYTRTDSPRAALRKLADLVPLAVVTDGSHGAYALDADSGEEVYCPAVMAKVVDATGAGDVFASGLVLGTLAGWPLEQRLRFAALCSALAVQQFGGSFSAPGWAEISAWWESVVAREGSDTADLVRAYAFLDDVLPPEPPAPVARAAGTFTT